MIDFKFQTPPLSHQIATFDLTKDLAQYALFWEMGAGKTKAVIDQAAWLFHNGKIDAVLVIAPDGVHANWDIPGDGLALHLDDRLYAISWRLVWHSKRSKLKATQHAYNKLLTSQFAWLFMTYDAVNTKDGYSAAERFLKQRRTLFVLDESTRVKTSGAQRTKAAKKLRLHTPYRRILTGTPMEQKPFDVYSQIDWLIPGYWKQQGLSSYIAFKHFLADWRKARSPLGHEFEVQLTDRNGKPVYKNLDELWKMLQPIASRVKRADVLDLPDKIYSRAYYELANEQRKMYDKMEEDFVLWFEQREGVRDELNRLKDAHGDESDEVLDFLADNQNMVLSTAEIAIVRQLRLHQLAMGYVTDDIGHIRTVTDPNPALDLLTEITEDLSNPALIWCRFRKDVELIMDRLGTRAVRYDGTTPSEERTKAVAAIQSGDKQFFVATNAAAEGITLTAAKTSIYYSNDRKLGKRLQSEDRNMRIGQDTNVQYIDLLARNTISELILDQLLHGEEVSAAALGEKIVKKWS